MRSVLRPSERWFEGKSDHEVFRDMTAVFLHLNSAATDHTEVAEDRVQGQRVLLLHKQMLFYWELIWQKSFEANGSPPPQ